MLKTFCFFQCICLLTIAAIAAVPPEDRELPIGYTLRELLEYKQQSKPIPFLDSFIIEKKPYARPLYTPMPEEYQVKNFSEYPSCSLADGDQKNDLTLRIWFPNRLHLPTRYEFTPKLNLVFPIYSELYRVSNLGQNEITIERTTASVDKAVVPQGFSQTIYLNTTVAILHHPHSGYKGFVRVIAIQGNHGEVTATIQTREPFATLQEQNAAIKDNAITISSEKKYKAGDYIASQYEKYLIKKIVPPGPVDPKDPTKGQLIGWVEIDPRPQPVENKAETPAKK